MNSPLYVCRCGCKRAFTTTCPSLTECSRCAAQRLLARPVACVDTATERLLFARLHFEAHGNDGVDQDSTDQNSADQNSEFGAEPLPEEDDAAVTALLTGHPSPHRLGLTWLEYALGVMLTVVVWLACLTGGFHP